MNHLFSPRGKYKPWLLLPVGVLTLLIFELIWAESAGQYERAEASLLTIIFLVAFIAWDWWRATHEPPQLPTEAAAYNRAIRRLLRCIAIGYAALIVSATRWEHWQNHLVAQSIGYGTLIAGAFFMSGLLVGFLFGFRPTTQNLVDQSSNALLHPVTNLEEIADWLTKLLLGAGLVELTRMRTPLRELVYFIARGVEGQVELIPGNPAIHVDAPGNPAIALAIIGFFFTSGILYGYLWTRYELSLASDMAGADASALALVDRWLNQTTTSDDRTCVEMMNAVKSAPLPIQMKIFLQAEQYRKPSTEELNARSLPIFQALVESDPHEVFHRNRGQYALALMGRKKDPHAPDNDWNAALNLLNKAISIRDGSGETGWRYYEFARAVCQVHLDMNFQNGKPSNAEVRHTILADLDKTQDVPQIARDLIDKANVIADWRRQNPDV
jgi:hypothetical protein